MQRAIEDILERLDMPSLELYHQPAVAHSRAEQMETRGNSAEPTQEAAKEAYTQRNVSPDPINSLMEATELNGLRSQLRTVKLRRKGGMRRKDTDLISDNVLSHEEAEALLAKFKQSLSLHLYSAAMHSDATLDSIRSSSTVLFEAIMLVASLHIPGKEHVHKLCHARVMALVSAIMFDRFHTLDDIRGLCIAALWQPDLSWKISGLGMRIATELNLQHALYETFSLSPVDKRNSSIQKESLEKARVWYLLYLIDHQSGVAYGRPPMKSALRPIKDIDILLQSPLCTPSDRALLAQVLGFTILSRAFDHFGLEPNRAMDGTDESLLHHMRFTEELRLWMQRWSTADDSEFSRSIMLQFHFSDLVLHSLVLRGRPLDKLVELPACLRPLALKAIYAAHAVLEHYLHNVAYRDEIMGLPFYLHAMIAFAVVFLLKLSRLWHAMGVSTDPHTVSWPLIQRIIGLLRSCETGKNHTVYRMADGFARMLARLRKTELSARNAPDRTMRLTRGDGNMGPGEPDMGHDEQPFVSNTSTQLATTTAKKPSLPSPDYDDLGVSNEQPYNLLGDCGPEGLLDMDFLSFDWYENCY